MRKDWKIKKLGEVCTIISGSDYKDVQDEQGEYPIYGTGGIMGYANMFRCPENSTIIGRKGSINKPIFVNQKFWNVDTAFGVVPHQEILNPLFFFYFCRDYDFTKHDVSVTIPSLRKIDLVKIEIPIPPLTTQQQIVKELDLLTTIIDKQKAQLVELDKLAQSTFYSMFGDPVENEKGWEVKKLGDICGIGSSKRVFVEELVETGIPFYRGTEIGSISTDGKIEPSLFITKEHYKRLANETGVPKVGDLLLPSICPDGRIMIIKDDEPFYFKDGRVLWIKNNELVFGSFYLKALLKLLFETNYERIASGTTFAELKIFILKKLPVLLPPITLQQQFAEKIEAIEKQKTLIKQSIAQSEQLFNSRMQYYFE